MSEQLIINIVAEFKRLSAEDRSFVLKTLKEIQDKDAERNYNVQVGSHLRNEQGQTF